jgi:hypothetical protein
MGRRPEKTKMQERLSTTRRSAAPTLLLIYGDCKGTAPDLVADLEPYDEKQFER